MVHLKCLNVSYGQGIIRLNVKAVVSLFCFYKNKLNIVKTNLIVFTHLFQQRINYIQRFS